MTQLCEIPGCRIIGRHLGGCDDDKCRGCLPRTAEGRVCEADLRRYTDRLTEIIALAPDARLVAAGLVRRSHGAGGGKPGSRSPGNDDALDTLHDVNNRLTTTARDIATVRGLQEPQAGRGVTETTTTAAQWLLAQTRWLEWASDEQGGPYAAAVMAEVADCASRLRSVVNGPAEQRFLGPCGAEVTWDDDDNEIPRDRPCTGDVYGRPDAQQGTCRTCGARWPVEARRTYLGGEVRDHAYRAAHIADAYGISADTIRSWASRGKLRSYWVTAAGLTVPWADPEIDDRLKGEERAAREAEVAAELKARGPRVHYVGDVLDLAAADAARRENERAKRARRKEQAA